MVGITAIKARALLTSQAVFWAVFRTVFRTVYWAVFRTVLRTVWCSTSALNPKRPW